MLFEIENRMRGRLLLMAAVGTVAALSLPWQAAADQSEDWVWHVVDDWEIEGQGWPVEELKSRYDRLPTKAEAVVRKEVWSLSRASAGQLFRFNSDATSMTFRYTLGSERIAMSHMPATGVSGIDLYALDDDGQWRWVSTSRPSGVEVEHKVSDLDPGKRTYMVYLPLYNQPVTLSVGVPRGAVVEPVTPRQENPIVFYGTSITQGACASRPGLVHTAILGRRLDRPVINLGFSNQGRMDLELASLMAEIDASAYVIDCLPNMGDAALVEERTEPLVRKLREIRPGVPIILVEDRTLSNAWIHAEKRDRQRARRTALAAAYDRLVEAGVRDLFYLPGDPLLGDDDEATVDGSHPNDVGFFRMADAFEPLLRKVLQLK